MTFNMILTVSGVFLGINENPPIEENNTMSKKIQKAASMESLLF